MKKNLFIMFGVFVILMVTVSMLLGMSPKILNNWSNEKLIVMANKEWTVDFSHEIDRKTINNETIYVTDNQQVRQDVSLSLSDDGKAVTIMPPKDGYRLDATYYILHVKKEVKATNGRSLNGDKMLTFVVKENLPVVGTKKKLDEIFTTAIKRQRDERGFRFFSFNNTKESMEESSVAEDSAGGADGQSQGYSETNVQVQGVDEADTVKTDGTYIYQVQDGKVLITKASPVDEMNLEGTILYKDTFSPSQLFLYDHQLVVIGYSYEERSKQTKKAASDSLMWPGYYYSTRALVYDVSNKKEPKQIRDVEVEGNYVTSRRMNDYIYIISNHYPDIWTLEQEENVELRPRYHDSVSSDETQVIDYDDIRYFPNSNETNYTMIASFSLEEPMKEVSITTYLGSGNQLYMSKENLYLAVTNYSEMIGIRADVSYSPDSSVYKFSVKEDQVEFEYSTEIPGTILNQFSMDEHNGNFRVVTTKGDTWNDERPSANNLYIFDENLKRIGQIEGLARGERIYSARFMGERIYVVTFKQVDPLFVIDASNPEKPSVLGELKIPGFSNYLHPYDENHIIGFGHDTKVVPSKQAGEEPLVLTQGVKVSLFDVSDVTNPKEKFSEIIGGRGTYSPLNYDHKALLFHKQKGLFAFPISIYHDVKGSEYEQRFEFQGGYVYHLDVRKGFSLQGKITHMTGTHFYEDWESSISRMLYIGDFFYALSPSKITAHDSQSFEQKGEVVFTSSKR